MIIHGPLPPGVDDDRRASELHFIYAPLAVAYCFYCGSDPDTYPLVCWRGADAVAFLHPECAQRLALHLAKDGMLAAAATPSEARR